MRNNRKLDGFLRADWIKYWAGRWSVYSCSIFGQQYTRGLWKVLGTGLKKTVIIVRKGYSTAYLDPLDRARFGSELAFKAIQNPRYVDTLCENLVKAADAILSLMRARKGNIGRKAFLRFLSLLDDYMPWHVAVKNIVDYLPQEDLQKHLPALERARVHSEPVFRETEEFEERFAKTASEETGMPPELFLCMTKEEMEKYLDGKRLQRKNILEKRFRLAALVFNDNGYEILENPQAGPIEKAVTRPSGQLRGSCAYPGKACGRVRIILEASKCKAFDEGDILVSEMTRPEYLPFIRKAGAVVTDAGGMLCHAAIVARELKKPTVVGTQNATRTLKEGDMVEVDAEKGTVRHI